MPRGMSLSTRAHQIQQFADVTRALPHNLCSHLQNVTRKRMQATSIPYSSMNLGIANVLLRHGFISNVTRGPPVRNSTELPRPEAFDSVPSSSQILHLVLKYRSSFPVLSRARCISKPRFHLYASKDELKGLLHGSRVKKHRGIGAGEVVVVRTPEGRYLEGWEALAEGTGGEVIAAFG